MVKTKLTKRAGARKCPMCAEVFHGDVEFSNHVVQCAMQEYTCDFCDFTSQKECNVKRHMKRAHKGLLEDPLPLGSQLDKRDSTSPKKLDDLESELVVSDSDSEKEEWLSQDPGDILDLETTDVDKVEKVDDVVKDSTSDLLEGRVFRKRTTPILPGKRSLSLDTKESGVSTAKSTQTDAVDQPLKCDATSQTEFATEIVKKTIKKFRKGEIDIEEITTEKNVIM